MTQVHWIVEHDIFEENSDKIAEACKKFGHICHQVKYKPFTYEQKLPDLRTNDCVVFYGSLNLAHNIIRNDVGQGYNPWQPGVYYTPENFLCSKYYSYFGEHMVNGDCAFMPWSEFIRRGMRFPGAIDTEDCVFIRPDSGSKTFTGQLVYADTFDANVKEMTLYSGINPETLVMMSRPKRIVNEYRLIVVDDEIITGSRYIAEGRLAAQRIALDSDIVKYAYTVLDDVKWRPDSHAWVIDIAQTLSDGYKVMEIGCFSCCGLYDCDIETIIKEVSEAAIKEHAEYWSPNES